MKRQKPYFNLDTNGVDRELGVRCAKGVELSISGDLLRVQAKNAPNAGT